MCPNCKSTKEPTLYCVGKQEPYEVCIDCGKRFDNEKINNTLPLKEYGNKAIKL